MHPRGHVRRATLVHLDDGWRILKEQQKRAHGMNEAESCLKRRFYRCFQCLYFIFQHQSPNKLNVWLPWILGLEIVRIPQVWNIWWVRIASDPVSAVLMILWVYMRSTRGEIMTWSTFVSEKGEKVKSNTCTFNHPNSWSKKSIHHLEPCLNASWR